MSQLGVQIVSMPCRVIVFICMSLFAVRLAAAQQPVALKDTQELREQNSKLYVFYSGNRKLDDYINLQASKKDDIRSKDIVVSLHAPREGLTGSNPNEKSQEAYLLSATAASDLVVIAYPLDRNSAATEGNEFVFSDYEVAVDRVFSAHGITVLPGQHLVVTRPGGTIQYRGRTIVGSVPEFYPFSLNEPYLMFLRLLQNGTFLVVGESAYNLSDLQITMNTDQRISNNIVKRKLARQELLDDVERAVKRLDKAGK